MMDNSINSNSSQTGPQDENNKSLLLQVFTEIASMVRGEANDDDNHIPTPALSTTTKLRLYGLYKQATAVQQQLPEPPPMWHWEAKAKYDAWSSCRHLTQHEAMEMYIQQVLCVLKEQEEEPNSNMRDRCQTLWQDYQRQKQSQQEQNDNENEQHRYSERTETQQTACSQENEGFFEEILFEEDDEEEKPTRDDHSTSTALLLLLRMTYQSFGHCLASWIPPPLIPRGQLDISYACLLRTLLSCLWAILLGMISAFLNTTSTNQEQHCRLYEQRIAQVWNKNAHRPNNTPPNQSKATTTAATTDSPSTNTPSDVLVGLSVRSLLDLYLLANHYPPGSEIILAPAITVPGMMRVLQHHQITIVGVDVNVANNQQQQQSDNVNDHHHPQYNILIDVDAIRQKVTDKTVAIMVVHPFGRITASENDWKDLRTLANAHKLHLLEDCAQVYAGTDSGYRGSPWADVSFFSFGLIKTATALGGGLAIFPRRQQQQHDDSDDPQRQETLNKMNRLQWSRYNRQSPKSYLMVVLKALCLRLLTQNEYVYSLVLHSLRWCGCNVDALATRLSRAFVLNNDDDSWMPQIRQKPCTQLVATLWRRLDESSVTHHVIHKRRRLCQLLESHLDPSLVPFPTTKSDAQQQQQQQQQQLTTTHWLFPVRYTPPPNTTRMEHLDRIRSSSGIDVAQSASQLICADKDACPRATKLMQSILYLPVSLPPGKSTLSASRIQCLSAAMSPTIVPTSKKNRPPEDLAVWNMVMRYLFVLWMFLRFSHVMVAVSMIGCSPLVAACILIGAVCWAIRGFYLNHSDAFLKYCWMLDSNNKDTIPSPKILESMDSLKLSIGNDAPDSKTIFLTGATGFVGSLILHDLLKHREKLGLKKVIVLSRAKRGLTARERIDRLLSLDIFQFDTPKELKSIVQVVDGDVSKHSLGLSIEDRESLINDFTISHVIHSAASVSFTQSISNAAETNISGPLNVQKLTESMSSKNVILIHMSTAFVHGSKSGNPSAPLGEKLFSFESFDPEEVYQSMLNPASQYLAEKCMMTLGFPNTYTFSKSICEHMLTKSKVKTVVMRPSIVGPSAQYPHEGWAGTKPSTFVAAACLYLHFQWNLWCFGPQQVPCIPVDVLSQFVLKTISDDSEYFDGEPSTTNFVIRNAAWDSTSPESSSFTWLQFAVSVMQFGSSLGYFNRFTAYVGLLFTKDILPRLNLTQNRFRQLHQAFVLQPFKLYLKVASTFGVDTRVAEKLLPYLDFPLLFFPFATKSFYFSSPLVAPKDFCGERYASSCVLAAHAFSNKENSRKPESNFSHLDILRLRGRSLFQDLFWAYTQPRGSIIERISGLILCSILRQTCSEVTVDVLSLAKSLRNSGSDKHKKFLLLPTHRSFFDFLLISFICFSLPELQLELPIIAAAADFERLPFFGMLLKFCRVIFVTRGIGKSGLKKAEKELCSIIDNQPLTLEIYIEGTRSRDRRFASPKTGLLRSIHALDNSFVVVPLTLSYEKIAEQDALVTEASGGFSGGLRVGPLFSWLKRVFCGSVSLGRIHLAAGESLRFNDFNESSMRTLVTEVQSRQRNLVMISDFHVTAAAKVLRIPVSTLKAAFGTIGCTPWHRGHTRPLKLPSDPSVLWTIALQAAHYFAPLIRSELPHWATWLCRDETLTLPIDTLSSPHVKTLTKALIGKFSEAESAVSASLQYLESRGFGRPSSEHLLQTVLQNDCESSPILIKAAISFLGFDFSIENTPKQVPVLPGGCTYNLTSSQERLGFWGFQNTSFALKCGKMGMPYVTVTGDRYPLRNKKFTKLLPFIEKATGVRLDPLRGATLSSFALSKSSIPSVLARHEIDELARMCNELSTSLADRTRHGTGHSLSDVLRIRRGEKFRVPDAVVWPCSVDEVKSIVSLSQKRNWCLIPFGGGTTVSQAVCCPSLKEEPRPIISVDMRRLNKVLLVDHENMIAHVEAGITGLELIKELKRQGFTMGHEPDSLEFSTLGGWIATKASGMKRNKYGNIEEIVTGVKVVGNNGLMEQGHFGRVSCGLDLTALMLGSEGCLGIIVSAAIRIKDLPQVTDHDSILLPDFETGVRLMKSISRLGPGGMPASCRLLDNEHFRMGRAMKPESESSYAAAKEYLGSMYVQWNGLEESRIVCLALGFEGSESEVRIQKGVIAQLAKSFGGLSLGRHVGKASYDMTFMIAYLRDFALTYGIAGESFETFAPWSEIHSIVSRTKERIVQEHRQHAFPGKPFVGCRVTQIYSDGVCLYFYLCMSINGIDGNKQLASFSHLEEAARSEILARGGSLSHHHGVGKLRAEFMPQVQSKATHDVFQRVKASVDPVNIFGARNGSFATRDETQKSSNI